MDGLKFNGRGYSDPRLVIDTDENGLKIRADDGRNYEVWAEVTISPAMLAELMSRVCVHLGADAQLLLPLLRRLTEPLEV